MHINDFTYTLPQNLIAQHPPRVRGSSRLLGLNKATGKISHGNYFDLDDYLEPGDMVILNDTKVIKARLVGEREDKTREFLLLEKHGDNTIDTHHWKVLYKGKIHFGEVYSIGDHDIAVEEVLENGIAILSSSISLLEIADKHGTVPLPPYMRRNATQEDIERYQTEFARSAGSVAAPTASLNFTKELEEELRSKGVIIGYLTLHVGLGTFLPIRTDTLEDHKMHSEYFEVSKETVRLIQQTKQANKKILAVGTTVTRTLEHCAPQILDENPRDIVGEADIFIYGEYDFRVVDILLTNFHAPKTTVLMLSAAFAGWPNLQKAYQEALKENYAFLSYGDSMLIY